MQTQMFADNWEKIAVVKFFWLYPYLQRKAQCSRTRLLRGHPSAWSNWSFNLGGQLCRRVHYMHNLTIKPALNTTDFNLSPVQRDQYSFSFNGWQFGTTVKELPYKILSRSAVHTRKTTRYVGMGYWHRVIQPRPLEVTFCFVISDNFQQPTVNCYEWWQFPIIFHQSL